MHERSISYRRNARFSNPSLINELRNISSEVPKAQMKL